MRRFWNLIACSELLIVLLGSHCRVEGFVSPSGSLGKTLFSFQLYDVAEPLVSEGDWQAFLDEETTGMVYYFNSVTGESLWQPPTDTFPEVYLKPSVRRRAERLRESYFGSLNQDEGKGFGLLGSLFKQEPEETVEEEVPDWIQTVLEEDAEKVKEVEKEEPGFFSKLLSSKESDDVDAATTSADATKSPFFLENEDVDSEPTTPGLFKSMFSTIDKVKQDAVSKAEEAQQAAGKVREAAAKKAEEAREAAAKKAEEAKEVAAKNAEKAKEVRAQKAEEAQEIAARKAEEAQKVAEAKAAEKAEAERLRKQEAERKEEERKEKARLAQEALEAKLVEAEKLAAQAKQAALDRAQGVKRKEAKKVKTTEVVKLDVGSFVLPNPAKILWGGEDAVFTKGRNFAVFDGVSGAEKADGLPLYSKTLVRELKKNVGADSLTVKELQDSLLEAAKVADESATGASTALVGSISEDGFLRTINLGDSSCIVVRDDRVAVRTKEIVHYFDCPYQLSIDSPDRPRDARKLNVELVPGDVIVAGSDGVFDNLTDSQIVELIQKGRNKKSAALAKQVSDLSRKVSFNEKIETPYSKQAKRNGDPDYKSGLGGKVDDISCVVIRYE